MQGTLYDQLGGEAKLRQIIDTFIDRVFEDRMIGFFFRNADRKRIKEMELQLTARFLGADVEYQGRPLDEVHAKHPIMGGQFARRLQILSETLEDYGVPRHIRDAWLEHSESLDGLALSGSGALDGLVRLAQSGKRTPAEIVNAAFEPRAHHATG